MRNLILISALFTFYFSSFSQEVLDNQSVIDMIELGFNEQVIIDKIESTNSSFETSLEKLKSLKLLGVSQNILSIMIKESKVKIPLNGEYIDYWENEILKSKANYVDGKLQGTRSFYYDNGCIKEEVNFLDGKQENMTFHYDLDGNRIK